MTDTLDIDRIVREVVRRVRDHGQAAVAPATPANSPSTSSPDELAISDRLVTLESIHGRLTGVRRLVLLRGAVVTPSVRDELIEQNVAIVRSDSTTNGSTQTDAPVLFVGVTGTNVDPTDVIRGVKELVGRVERIAAADLTSSVDKTVKAVADGNALGLLLTGEPAVALCLANRHPAIRAASGADRRLAQKAVESIGANVLVIDPAAVSKFDLKHIIQEFVVGGLRDCPATLRA